MVVQRQQKNVATKAMENIKNCIAYETDCSFHARVVKYDATKHLADIVPLNNASDGSAKAQILDVPVSKNCYAFDEWLAQVKGDLSKIDRYADDKDVQMGTSLVSKIPQPLMKKGAIVACIVLDHDTDGWDGSNQSYTPPTNRQHDINDAQIVGVF